jgi:hypothetical protein
MTSGSMYSSSRSSRWLSNTRSAVQTWPGAMSICERTVACRVRTCILFAPE